MTGRRWQEMIEGYRWLWGALHRWRPRPRWLVPLRFAVLVILDLVRTLLPARRGSRVVPVSGRLEGSSRSTPETEAAAPSRRTNSDGSPSSAHDDRPTVVLGGATHDLASIIGMLDEGMIQKLAAVIAMGHDAGSPATLSAPPPTPGKVTPG